MDEGCNFGSYNIQLVAVILDHTKLQLLAVILDRLKLPLRAVIVDRLKLQWLTATFGPSK